MAEVQHSSLSDPEIHEPKGASTALSGQFLKADGSGGTVWDGVDYSEVGNTPSTKNIQTLELEAYSNSDQLPTGTDAPLNIKFDTASSTLISIDADGVCTASLSDQRTFLVDVSLNIGVKGGDGTATNLYVSKLVNGSVEDTPIQLMTDSVDNIQTLSHSFLWTPFNGNTLQYQLVRDSASEGQGGLYKFTPALTGQSVKH